MGFVKAVEYVQGIQPEIDSLFDRNVNNLIILDDMMDEGTQDKRVSRLFRKVQYLVSSNISKVLTKLSFWQEDWETSWNLLSS